MEISDHGLKLLRIREGVMTKAYLDTGKVLTIGVGFTWASASFRKWWNANRPGKVFNSNSTMTLNEIDQCLKILVDQEYGKAVVNFLGHTVVAQHVFDAMVSMVFNCGPGSLKWQWAQHIKAGNLKTACEYWRKTATTDNGKSVKGLIKRRNEEADQALHGYGTLEVYPKPVEKPVTAPEKPVEAIKPVSGIPAPPSPIPAPPVTYGTAPVPTGGWLAAIIKAIMSILKGSKP